MHETEREVMRLFDAGAGTANIVRATGLSVGQIQRVTSRLAVTALERSEEHTSELQALMRISYAVFCLKKHMTKHTQQLLQLQVVLHRNKPTHNYDMTHRL